MIDDSTLPTLHDSTPGVLGTLALVLVVSLAGCSVAGVPLGAPDPYTDSAADLDAEALRAAHTDALVTAGSYNATTNVTLRTGDGALTVDRTAAVDVEGNRSLATSRLGRPGEGGLSVATYTEGNTTARRVVLDGDDGETIRYDAARAPYDDGFLSVSSVDGTAQTNGHLVATAVDAVEWTQHGVERHDGGWVTRYEATGAANVSDLGGLVVAAATDAGLERTGLSASDLDADSANATLLVSPDGVVRAFTLSVTATEGGETTTLTLSFSTDDVGSADAQRPAWVDEATDDLDD